MNMMSILGMLSYKLKYMLWRKNLKINRNQIKKWDNKTLKKKNKKINLEILVKLIMDRM